MWNLLYLRRQFDDLYNRIVLKYLGVMSTETHGVFVWSSSDVSYG
jgi:hypothetical protein